MAINQERLFALLAAYDQNPDSFSVDQIQYLQQLADEAGVDWQPKTSMARLARNALFGAADTAAFGLLPNEWGGPAITGAERIAGQVGSAAGMFFGGPAFLGRAAVKGAGRLATKYAAKIPNWMKVAEATTPAAEAAATTGADTAAGFLSNMTAKAGQVFKTAAANAGPLAMGAGRAGLQYGVMAGSSDVTNPEEAIARFFQGATTGAIGNTLGALTPEKMKLLAGTIYGLFGGGSTDSVENALIGMASFMGGKYTPMAAAGRAAEAVAETAAPAAAEAAGAAARTASRFKPSTSTGRAANTKASQSGRVYAAAERAYMTKGDEAPGYIFRKLKEMKYSDKQAIRIINKAQEALYKSGKLQQGRAAVFENPNTNMWDEMVAMSRRAGSPMPNVQGTQAYNAYMGLAESNALGRAAARGTTSTALVPSGGVTPNAQAIANRMAASGALRRMSQEEIQAALNAMYDAQRLPGVISL